MGRHNRGEACSAACKIPVASAPARFSVKVSPPVCSLADHESCPKQLTHHLHLHNMRACPAENADLSVYGVCVTVVPTGGIRVNRGRRNSCRCSCFRSSVSFCSFADCNPYSCESRLYGRPQDRRRSLRHSGLLLFPAPWTFPDSQAHADWRFSCSRLLRLRQSVLILHIDQSIT